MTNFSIAAKLDASGFKAGTDQMADGLDNAAEAMADLERADLDGAERSLEDIRDAADDIAPKLEDAADGMQDLERATDDAANEADDLEKKFRDALDPIKDVEKAAKDLDGTDVEIDVDIDKQKSKEALNGFKEDVSASGNESGQELAGSMMDGFNGENVVEALTEVVAEATEGMSGPMQAAGIGLAIILALAYAEMAKIAEATNEAKEAGGEWATSYNTQDLQGRLDALRDSFQDFATEIADKSEWFEFGEAAETAFEQVRDGAKEGGASVEDFMNAFMEEDPTKRLELLSDALQTTKDRTAELQDQQKTAGFAESWDIANKTRELDESTEAIEGLVEEQRIALETEEAMAEAMGLTVDQFRDYNQLSDEAKERVDSLSEGQQEGAIAAETQMEALEELNDEVADLAGNARDAARAELDLADQLEDTNDVLKNADSSVRDKKNSVLDLIDAVLDSAEAEEEASGSVEGYNRVLKRNKDDLYRAGEAAGYTRDQIDRLTGSAKRVPDHVKVRTSAPGAQTTENQLRDVLTQAGIKKDLTVGVYANTSQASIDVANWRHAQESWAVSMKLRAV